VAVLEKSFSSLYEPLTIEMFLYKSRIKNGPGDPNMTASWPVLVEEFQTRVLSVPSDKLPALSGVAALFSTSFMEPDVYLAGLWKTAFAEGLLWSPLRYKTPDPKTTVLRHGHGRLLTGD